MGAPRPDPGSPASFYTAVSSLCDVTDDLVNRLAAVQQELASAQQAIGAEVSARQQAVSAEQAGRQNADAAEAQARDAANSAQNTATNELLNQERSDRDSAILSAFIDIRGQLGALGDGLRQALNAETVARTSADGAEQKARGDAIAGQARALSNAVADLQARIAQASSTAETGLDAAVAAQARALADALTQTKTVTDAISATLEARRLDFLAPAGRPGDAPLRYAFVSAAAALAGPRAALPLLPAAMLANGDSGPVVRAIGPGILAARAVTAIEPGRLYRVRYVVQRRANPSDPSGDTVRCGLVYLDQSLRVIGDVAMVRDFPALLTANGRQPYEAMLSRTQTPNGPIAAPASARFFVPVVQFFGQDHLTDVEVLAAEDATTAYVLPVATADLAAQVAALVAGDFDARLQAIESAVGTAGMMTFKSKGDARYGTIPDSVQVVTLLGRQYEGDGGGGRYVRTSAQVPDGADSFTSHEAVFLREVIAPDVVAGMLESGFETWVAGLPTEPPPGSGKRWADHGMPAVTP